MAAGRDGAPARSGRADRLGQILGGSSPDHMTTNKVIATRRRRSLERVQEVVQIAFDGQATVVDVEEPSPNKKPFSVRS
jgi:hypothetical protein